MSGCLKTKPWRYCSLHHPMRRWQKARGRTNSTRQRLYNKPQKSHVEQKQNIAQHNSSMVHTFSYSLNLEDPLQRDINTPPPPQNAITIHFPSPPPSPIPPPQALNQAPQRPKARLRAAHSSARATLPHSTTLLLLLSIIPSPPPISPLALIHKKPIIPLESPNNNHELPPLL